MSIIPPNAPSQLDSYIIERIIRALELVTEMGAKLALLEKTNERHERILEGDGEPLPIQVFLLRKEVTQLRETWDEKETQQGVHIAGRYQLQAAVIPTLITMLLTGIGYAVVKLLGW